MPGSARELNRKRLLSKGEEMKKLIAMLLLAFASGCVASGIRYRPCHELRTDMSVSNDEYYYHCPRRGD
jgi:hypothetical protein